MHNIDRPAAELNNDLAKISYRVQKWKMSFNQIIVNNAKKLF